MLCIEIKRMFNNYSCKMLSFQFLYTALSWFTFKLQHVADVPDFLNVIVFDRQVLVLL